MSIRRVGACARQLPGPGVRCVGRLAETGLAAALAAIAVTDAAAQAWPVRPVRLVVPYAPGGGTDILGRIVGQRLGEQVGQPVVIDNRSGGGTIIGSDIVAKAAPDGHTLLMNTTALVINSALHAKLPYDLARDFRPVMRVAIVHNVLVVSPTLPVTSVKGLLDHARTRPGGVNFATSGVGTAGHIAGELLRAMSGIPLTHVPYRGGAPLIPDLIAGQVHFIFGSMPTVLPLIEAGRLRALGVASATRAEALPHLPTIAESGMPGFDVTSWQGVFAPGRTPPALVERINGELKRVIALPEVRRQLAANGFEPVGSSVAEFSARIEDELARWTKLIRASGARPE